MMHHKHIGSLWLDHDPSSPFFRSADTEVQAVAQHWLLWYLHFPWEEARNPWENHGHGREILAGKTMGKPREGNP